MSEVERSENGGDEEFYLPPASFETLARSLITQAQFALLSFETEKGKHEPDVQVARHYIDLLAMLQEKTAGHLTLEEQRLLDNAVTELRFRYVRVCEETRPPAQTESAQA